MDNGFISEVHTVQSSKDPRSLAYFWMLHEKKRNFSAPRYCNLVMGDISLPYSTAHTTSQGSVSFSFGFTG